MDYYFPSRPSPIPLYIPAKEKGVWGECFISIISKITYAPEFNGNNINASSLSLDTGYFVGELFII